MLISVNENKIISVFSVPYARNNYCLGNKAYHPQSIHFVYRQPPPKIGGRK